MIHVDRSKIAVPAILRKEKKGGGLYETRQAVLFYQKQLAEKLFQKSFDQLTEAEKDRLCHFMDTPLPSPLEGKNFDFGVYSSGEVRQALADLFHGKCAYCESRYAGTQPMDVEHWRPKGGFVDENDPAKDRLVWPGYFWLAADWENLLPSCIDCNRKRKQVVWSQPQPLLMGKESQFPVADEGKRWRFPDLPGSATAAEEPLLLNPCAPRQEDWPEAHLTFDLQEATLLPRPDPKNPSQSSPKALASIRVYALNRTDLVLARQELLRLMEYHRQTILRLMTLLEHLEERPEENRDELMIVDDLLRFEFAVLDHFTEAEQPYALLARAFLQAIQEEFQAQMPPSS